MQKKTIHFSESKQIGFSWVREPNFTPPGKDGGVGVCLTHEFAEPRAGELRSLLETFLESIIGATNATAGVVRLHSLDGCTLEIISSAGLSNELQGEAENFDELDCEVSDIATSNDSAHSSDISNCEARQNCCYVNCRFRSLIAVPLISDTSEVSLGVLTIFFNVSREVSSSSIKTISAFAEMMSAAIEHTRINREIQRKERLLARQVIANDIHDSIAQTLTYARMRVSLLQEAVRTANEVTAARYANDLDEALEAGQKSVRVLITDFRCEMSPSGLLPALSLLVAEFRKHNDIVLEYHNRLVELELPLEHEIQVYHIVREALTNISRHSEATHARLFVDAEFGFNVFTIEDNGSGACTFTPVEGHYGVMIMRERAHRIGGKVKVESAAGLGTQVQLFFPEPSSDWRATNE